MSDVIAWEVRGKGHHVVAFNDLAAKQYGAEGYTVTPLVAAPSPQTVEEVTQAIDNLIVVVRRSESTSGPYHDWKAADDALAACRAELIALVAGGVSHITRIDLTPEQERRLTADGVEEIPSLGHCATPPEGAPTYAELAEALRDARAMIDAVLSRIPKGGERQMSALGTMAEREMRGFLRRLVKEGFDATDSYEDPVCFYCYASNNGRATKHGPHCLYVRAKELLAKYPASHV